MKKKRILSLTLTLLLALSLIPIFGISAIAATFEVSTLQELKDALGTAQEGDTVSITGVTGYIALYDELLIPADVTVINADDVYFFISENGVINIKGALINNGAINVSYNGSIINYGAFINNFSFSLNDTSEFTNNGSFLNNGETGGIVNHTAIYNNGDFNNEGYLFNSNLIDNTGTINNANGNITNSGTIKNSGSIITGLFYNDNPGIIENDGLLHNIGHFNNNTGKINNYNRFVNNDYFYNDNGGSVINFGGTIESNGAWVGEPYFDATVTAEVSASVLKLKGNQNLLTITITEYYSNGAKESTDYDFMINNNAAGVYSVGGYKVYVDTKGNDDIRACYFVETT